MYVSDIVHPNVLAVDYNYELTEFYPSVVYPAHPGVYVGVWEGGVVYNKYDGVSWHGGCANPFKASQVFDPINRAVQDCYFKGWYGCVKNYNAY